MSAAYTHSSTETVLYVAMELAQNKWLLTIGRDGDRRVVRRTMPAGNLAAFMDHLERARKVLKLSPDTPTVACYEAGRDGFWIQRALDPQGIRVLVIDPASVEMPRRFRRAKTDKLDGKKLLRILRRLIAGEEDVCRVCQLPSPEQEDQRQLHRELLTWRKKRTAQNNRIIGLLVAQGVRTPVNRTLRERLDDLRTGDGRALPPMLRRRLERELDDLHHLDAMISKVERQRREALKSQNETTRKVRTLCGLRGIGDHGAWMLVTECFGWRRFRNRRELASYVGLDPTPFSSGNEEREQGISKSGNKRLRSLMVLLGWFWVRHQPNSELSRWFQRRFGGGTKRTRRRGIVALARKLLIALWRYVEEGVLPAGAELKAA